MDNTRYKNSYKSEYHYAASLSVYNVGFAECCDKFSWGPGIRDHYLLHYVSDGEGEYIAGGVRHHIKAGDTFCAFPNTTITYSANPDNPWTYYWVGFNGTDAKSIMAETQFSQRNPVVSNSFNGQLQKLILKIYTLRGSRAADSARMVGKLFELLALFMQQPERTEGERTEEHVQAAVTFVRHNYSSNISIGDIAESAGISNSQLGRLFQMQFGCSPIRYLTLYRMDCACDLIKHTALPIETVAHSVGYYDQLYFARVFKRIVGLAPSLYRAEHSED